MNLQKRISEDFYKIFRTKNRESYMMFLVALYQENNRLLSSFGMTEEEGRAVIDEVMAKSHLLWQVDEQEMEENDTPDFFASSTTLLNRLIKWGWIRSTYDERINKNMLSFPEYSQYYIELFERLRSEEEGQERESILSIYSALFTYLKEKESRRDSSILRSALMMSRKLNQMLSNMQDGMQNYFEELSSKKDFIGVQKVLIDEINNSDSKRYAILTTTDGFYRYKESIRELISQILRENEENWENMQIGKEKENSKTKNSLEEISSYEMVSQLIYRIEREFNQIEKKYNVLIEQKTIFAKRALARLKYILQEGLAEEDSLLKVVSLFNQNPEKEEEILQKLRSKIQLSQSFMQLTDHSFYVPREYGERKFVPVPPVTDKTENQLQDFVPKPIYTKKQLQEFWEANSKNGIFRATKDTVHSVEDLEKLFFLWQDASKNYEEDNRISLEGEVHGPDGLAYSRLVIKEKQGETRTEESD